MAFPTETFYGLGADALSPEAVDRVFTAKARPPDKPLLVLVDSLAGARALVSEWPEVAGRLAARHWPGPLTLVFRAVPGLPSALTAGTGTVGVRIPGHTLARALVASVGRPVTAPSANPHGQPAPRTAADVLRGLGPALDPARDLVLDGGPTAGGPPSTVVDLTGPAPRVIRAGAISLGSPAGMLI